jgi:hypothetical protein
MPLLLFQNADFGKSGEVQAPPNSAYVVLVVLSSRRSSVGLLPLSLPLVSCNTK